MDGLNQQEGESGQLKEVKHQLARCAQHLHINTTDLSLAGAATSMIFVATKHIFCRDKSMLVATNVSFVANTKTKKQKRNKNIKDVGFVATKINDTGQCT